MSIYYVGKDGKQSGPFEEAEVRKQIANGMLAPEDLFWREGMAEWQAIGTMPELIAANSSSAKISTNEAETTTPLFLYIPISRLVILSILSCGLYEAYWFYKNWWYLKKRNLLDIRPFWRGIWALFFCHSLLRRMRDDSDARAVEMPEFKPTILAVAWIILTIAAYIMAQSPEAMFSIASALMPSFLFLIPVQNYVNSVTRKRNPAAQYHKWSSGHIVCVMVGITAWIGILIDGANAIQRNHIG